MIDKKKQENLCGWDVWGTKCSFEVESGKDHCKVHIHYKCVICLKQSTHGCSHYWGPGVCGTPYCDEHSEGKCRSCGKTR